VIISQQSGVLFYWSGWLITAFCSNHATVWVVYSRLHVVYICAQGRRTSYLTLAYTVPISNVMLYSSGKQIFFNHILCCFQQQPQCLNLYRGLGIERCCHRLVGPSVHIRHFEKRCTEFNAIFNFFFGGGGRVVLLKFIDTQFWFKSAVT